MIRRIIDFSLDNRFAILGLTLLLAAAGVYAVRTNPVDAIPDISETQIIVFADWPGRSPQEVEDQVTYPMVVNLQGLAGVRAVRSSSAFGFSMINVIFEDGTELYFARTRILERLSLVGSLLPKGVTPVLGPDASAVGQIFWYTVEGPGQDLGTLRAVQDFYVRYQLASVPGVAEVASIGGFVRQYQIDVDPNRLAAYGLTIRDVIEAVQMSNNNVGGKVLEKGGIEYIVRGLGLIHDVGDVEKIVVTARGGRRSSSRTSGESRSAPSSGGAPSRKTAPRSWAASSPCATARAPPRSSGASRRSSRRFRRAFPRGSRSCRSTTGPT